jgi:hypothetical protein
MDGIRVEEVQQIWLVYVGTRDYYLIGFKAPSQSNQSSSQQQQQGGGNQSNQSSSQQQQSNQTGNQTNPISKALQGIGKALGIK